MSWLDEVDVFVADWDETITVNDTIGKIADVAYSKKPFFEPRWNYFTRSYMMDLEAMDQPIDRSTLAKEREYQRRVREVEEKSIRRINRYGLFQGVERHDLLRLLDTVEIRPGFWDFAKKLQARNIPIIIVSIGWAASLVKAFFEREAVPLARIYANDINQGVLSGAMMTGADKEQALLEISNRFKNICYAGDSSTDILALAASSFPIVVDKEGTFARLQDLSPQSNVKFIKSWREIQDLN